MKYGKIAIKIDDLDAKNKALEYLDELGYLWNGGLKLLTANMHLNYNTLFAYYKSKFVTHCYREQSDVIRADAVISVNELMHGNKYKKILRGS